LDGEGNPLFTRASGLSLSTQLLEQFSTLAVENEEGFIALPKGERLETQPGGSVSLTASNITIDGDIISPGGSVALKALNASPFEVASLQLAETPSVPPAREGHGILRLGGMISAAGMISHDRNSIAAGDLKPVSTNAGQVRIAAYSALPRSSSMVDVSGIPCEIERQGFGGKCRVD
jgi:hypothetical protein